MNIFILHLNQRKIARWHVDKHVIKMLLETCQLLYTAHWTHFYPQLLECKSVVGLSRTQKQLQIPDYVQSAPKCESSNEPGYRPCHVWHPCARWTQVCSGNYLWLAKLGVELAREYTFRFGKEHSCQKHIEWLIKNVPLNMTINERQGFPIAMDDEFKISKDPIVCYRNYYKKSKKERGLVKYTKRQVPHWLRDE